MLWEIIKKEVRDQLLSPRLMLSFLLVLVLMSANALLFQAEYRHQLADYSRDVSLNLAALARNASSGYPLFTAFSWRKRGHPLFLDISEPQRQERRFGV